MNQYFLMAVLFFGALSAHVQATTITVEVLEQKKGKLRKIVASDETTQTSEVPVKPEENAKSFWKTREKKSKANRKNNRAKREAEKRRQAKRKREEREKVVAKRLEREALSKPAAPKTLTESKSKNKSIKERMKFFEKSKVTKKERQQRFAKAKKTRKTERKQKQQILKEGEQNEVKTIKQRTEELKQKPGFENITPSGSEESKQRNKAIRGISTFPDSNSSDAEIEQFFKPFRYEGENNEPDGLRFKDFFYQFDHKSVRHESSYKTEEQKKKRKEVIETNKTNKENLIQVIDVMCEYILKNRIKGLAITRLNSWYLGNMIFKKVLALIQDPSSCITHLDLSDNRLSDDSLLELAGFIARDKTVDTLRLQCQKIDRKRNLPKIVEAVKKNTTLVKFANDITSEWMDEYNVMDKQLERNKELKRELKGKLREFGTQQSCKKLLLTGTIKELKKAIIEIEEALTLFEMEEMTDDQMKQLAEGFVPLLDPSLTGLKPLTDC